MFILVSSTKFSLDIVLSEASLSTLYYIIISSIWKFNYCVNINTCIYRRHEETVTGKYIFGMNVMNCHLMKKGHLWESEGRKEGGKMKVVFVTRTS